MSRKRVMRHLDREAERADEEWESKVGTERLIIMLCLLGIGAIVIAAVYSVLRASIGFG